MFTPRKISELEPKIREFCAQCLDPLIDADRSDFVADLGAQMPMRVIGMLLGMPDDDQQAVRDRWDANLRTEAGQSMTSPPKALTPAKYSPDTSTGEPSTRQMTS